MGKSIEFFWNSREFAAMLESCQFDDAVSLSLKYLSDHRMKILEAGCGSGRVVKFLTDHDFCDVHGIELNLEAVNNMNSLYPELKIIQGDILKMRYERDSFDVVLSYGVVEHFQGSVLQPLESIYKVLKPGGIAVITVPSLNRIRMWLARYHLELLYPRTLVRAFRSLFRSNKKGDLYYSHPPFGDFFEYRLTPEEFENICKKADFEILESLPIAHIDGLYHIFGPLLVGFKNWKFNVRSLGRFVNKLLLAYPFLHNHMHACVLRKPNAKVTLS